jgi:hypothetical protein
MQIVSRFWIAYKSNSLAIDSPKDQLILLLYSTLNRSVVFSKEQSFVFKYFEDVAF